jgi:molybdopterin molybdotransferase
VSDLRTLDEALALVLERARPPLRSQGVPLAHAAGRVVAADAYSTVDLPPFPSSAMDGFAVRADDTPGLLPIAGRIAAGDPLPGALASGTAAGIATGAAVPDGADAVVPVELVTEEGGRVHIPDAAVAGAHIRPRGGDVHVGEVIAAAGETLRATRIGALAAAGVAEVTCTRRPRVAVLATGSELRAPGEDLEPGQIYESNRTMVAAVLAAAGAEVVELPVAPDDEDAHRRALAEGLEADVFVTTGGVSMGPHDLVRRIEADLGVEELFWKVAIKPGKPLSFGVRRSTLVFGLPGNPVSALVGSVVFVSPALRALQGASDPGPIYEHGLAARALRRNRERDEFLRARRVVGDAGIRLDPVTGQESHMIVRASSADALVHVARGEGEIAEGEPVRYLRLP